jgi:predicted SprT family Zn-dependent metalloprotease
MTVYVHAPGVSNIYHWCRNCSDYPSSPQGHRTDRPEGYLCDQCKAKEKDGNCTA